MPITITLTESALLIFLQSKKEKWLAWAGIELTILYLYKSGA